MNMPVIRLLFSFAGCLFYSSIVCFNSFYPTEARSQTGKKPLVRSTKLREAKEQGNQDFALQREKKELRARGVVVRFHRWPGMKQRKEVDAILKSQGLKRTRNIKNFKAQLFGWKEGGLKPSSQAERACVQIRGLSYVRRCSPDHLLPVNASRTDSPREARGALPDSRIAQDRQSRTEAVFFN